MITETWDENDTFDQEIMPLLNQIFEICKRDGIPMMAAFTVWASETDHHNKTFETRKEGRRIMELEDAVHLIRFE